jgi:nitrite reductase/ring-hydroxylating ferredoxin subunit
MNFKHQTFYSFLFVSLCFLFSSCKKNKNDDRVPYVPVNVVLNTSDPLFVKLNAPGGWVYINGGSRGIVIYRLSLDDFRAYDRHCTYQPLDACGKISVNASQIMAVDSCCGAEFVLTDGSVAKQPASRPLTQYTTSYDGNRLLITN